METTGLRGDNRNDPVAYAVAEEPGIKAALEARRAAQQEKMQQAVGEAIQATDERKLAAWVAVAVWQDENGALGQTVIGDDHSSPLELKGYLHDGVWTAAHAD